MEMSGMTSNLNDPASQRSQADAILETEGLTRKFGGFVAVDGVDLSIARNELRSIIGPNGAGKTTLFNMIAGVLDPTTGSIRLDGNDVTAVPVEERCQLGIGRSYQSNELFLEQTVFENVRMAAQTAQLGTFSRKMFGRAAEFAREHADEVLENVDLLDQREITAENLSHGDQRRLSIAIAIATAPDVLLLDEPTSGMSPDATEHTTELIRTIQAEMDVTILLIEHNMSVVLEISDKISVLSNGSLIATNTPEKIRENEAVQEAYLGGMHEEEI